MINQDHFKTAKTYFCKLRKKYTNRRFLVYWVTGLFLQTILNGCLGHELFFISICWIISPQNTKRPKYLFGLFLLWTFSQNCLTGNSDELTEQTGHQNAVSKPNQRGHRGSNKGCFASNLVCDLYGLHRTSSWAGLNYHKVNIDVPLDSGGFWGHRLYNNPSFPALGTGLLHGYLAWTCLPSPWL